MEWSANKAAALLLAIAVVGCYAASRAAAEALVGRRWSGLAQAMGLWIPTALVVLIAVVTRPAEIAISVIFGTSVAALTLVLGIITISARAARAGANGSAIAVPGSRRLWGFVLPAALIALLIGFSGGVGWAHVAVLAIEGLALLSLWSQQTNAPEARVAGSAAPKALPTGSPIWRATLLVFAIVAGGIGAWAGIRAAVDIGAELGLPGVGLSTALMLGPALVLPLIGSGAALAHEGAYDRAVEMTIGMVLLNLCVLFPLCAALWLSRPMWSGLLFQPPSRTASVVDDEGPATSPSTAPATAPSTSTPTQTTSQFVQRLFPYPMRVWRVDTVLLVAVGLFLLPAAFGRWTITPAEGGILLAVYVIYMAMSAALAAV